MLKKHHSPQPSFFDFSLDNSLKQNQLLSKVDDILNNMPELLHPLTEKYLQDRINKKIDIGFGKPTAWLETVIRLLLLKELHKNCAYRDVEERTETDLAWRAFAKLSFAAKVPDHTTLAKWANFWGEETICEVHKNIIKYCVKKKIIKGNKMRTDTTVTETNTHYPTDASILGDGIKVITRIIKKIKTITKVKTRFRDRVKEVKKKIFDMTNTFKKRTGEAKKKAVETVKEISEIAKRAAKQAEQLLREITEQKAEDLKKQLREKLELFKKLIDQTALVISGGKPSDRIVSFFQPFSRPIKKGKLSRDCEFGKKIEITEVEKGIISEWQSHIGNPADTDLLVPTIDRHKEMFGRDPAEVDTDRGYYSEENEEKLKGRVKRLHIPKRGYKDNRRLRKERGKRFRAGQNWRAGGEAKISWLKRSHGLGKSKAKTERGYDLGIGLGVIGCNLKLIAAIT